MKTSFFVEQNAIATYNTVSATIQCANLALFKAVAAVMWAHRARTAPAAKIQEVVDFFGISEVPSTSGYEPVLRSEAAKWIEAWTSLVDVSMAAARACECGKALEKLMTPALVAAKFGNSEPEAIDPTLLGLDPQLAAAFTAGSKKSAAERNLRDIADATEAAKEIETAFRSLRGNAQIDLFPNEVAQLIERYASQLRDGLVYGLTNGFYSRGGKVDPNRAGELLVMTEQLKVAEMQRDYLNNVGCADDTPDFDAEHA